MGRMKDLLAIIYGGGDEAVQAAQQIAGLSEVVPEDDGPRWIPVEERLPVDIPHGYCLVTDGKEVGTANYDKSANKFDHCIDRDYWTPTHWMPLPEPPAQ